MTRRSGSSTRGEHLSPTGQQGAQARAVPLGLLHCLTRSPPYYERKVSQDKRHNQALIALARRRCGVLFAMLRDGTFYTQPPQRLFDRDIGAPARALRHGCNQHSIERHVKAEARSAVDL